MTLPNVNKKCSRCCQIKPLTDFHKHARQSGGRAPYCKPCAAEYTREWKAAHPDKVHAVYLRYYQKNVAAVARRNAEWKNRNPDWHVAYRKSYYERRKGFELAKKFGITKGQYSAMLEKQGGACAICGKRDRRALSVDHDHQTGKVRALLCSRCNLAIGSMSEDVGIFAKAIEYLRAWSDRRMIETQNSLP